MILRAFLNRVLRVCGYVLLAHYLGACANTSDTTSAGMFGSDRSGKTGSVSRAGPRHGVPSGVAPGAMQRGTDEFLEGEFSGAPQATSAIVVPQDEQNVQLSLINASIDAAAKAVLSDTLGLNYVIDRGVEGQMTIQTTGAIPKEALFDLFEASLQANNAQLRRDGTVIRIVPGNSGNSTFRVAGRSGVTGSSIMVAPLRFVSAGEMAKLLEPLSEQGLKVVPEPRRNLLLLSGTSALMESALDALNLFDVDVLRGKSVALVRLKAADPDAVVTELKTIFEAEEGGMLNGVVDFVPNPRLGSVLVISSRAAYVDKAQRWIRELDQSAAGSSVYMETYPLQNRSASEVAPILDNLLNGSSSGAGVTASGGNSESLTDFVAMTDSQAQVASSSGASGSQMRVAADDSRNALVVMGDAKIHEQVNALLRSLDSAARQVLLEATIAEVTLNDEIEVGTRWFFESGNWDFRFTDLSNGSVVGSSPGFTAVFGTGDANVALSALASVTEVKVISAPTLMVLDNKEGILQIGDQVPIARQSTASSDTPNAPVLTQIEYRDTGIILRVKPRIGDGGRVLLDISQEVSDVAETRTSGIDSPTIRQRKIQTSVALGDGQTLALGGLVQEADNDSRSEVPGLGRVPVVGNLFRSRGSRKGRTELLILIRPRVVRNEQEAAEATEYWRGKLSKSNGLLYGGLGPAQHTLRDYK